MTASIWEASDPNHFFSKKDPQDLRLGDLVKAASGDLSKSQADLVIWGYPDDEGIALNGGRPGAHKAPEQIRKIFYKMTPHPELSKKPTLLDFGNISKKLSLADRHQYASVLAKGMTEQKKSWVSLGGGHDYGYADGAGFIKAHLGHEKKPVIINLDAHLDVRPTTDGLNSGTPFFRLLSEFPDQFEFFEVGIQAQCNSKDHLNWAKAKGAHILNLAQTRRHGLVKVLIENLTPYLHHPLWLSLDIDAITSQEAPGCSQSWTTGLRSDEILELMIWLKVNFQWQSFSIYEVSPDLDQDNRTSKLAALFMHQFLSLQIAKSSEMNCIDGTESKS